MTLDGKIFYFKNAATIRQLTEVLLIGISRLIFFIIVLGSK